MEHLRIAALNSLQKKSQTVLSNPTRQASQYREPMDMHNVPVFNPINSNYRYEKRTETTDNFRPSYATPDYIPTIAGASLHGPDFNGIRKLHIDPPSVPLSPRSAAFVNQNREILNRRKEERSPQIRSRSPSLSSVSGHNNSLGRWSESPSRSFKTTPNRRQSKSPFRENSNGNRNMNYRRNASRSPVRRSRSPVTDRRMRSPIRRSPHQHSNHTNSSVYQKQNGTNQVKQFNTNLRSTKFRRSPIRKRMDSPNNKRKRSRSPTGSKKIMLRSRDHNNRRRSQSRSRGRKFNQQLKFNNRFRRSPHKQRSRSNSLDEMNMKKRESCVDAKSNNKQEVEKRENEERIIIDRNSSPDSGVTEKSEEMQTENSPQTNQESVSDDSDSDSESTEKRSAIDLFASDESESENEGRFKSHSSKPERSQVKPMAVPFSALGKTTTSVPRNLDDVKTSETGEKDRHRHRRDNKSKDYRSGRYQRKRSRSQSRSRHSRRYNNKEERKNKDDETKRSKNNQNSDKRSDDKESKEPKFKSTFQALEAESDLSKLLLFLL